MAMRRDRTGMAQPDSGDLRRKTPTFSETVTISPGFAVRQYRCIAGVAPDFLASVSCRIGAKQNGRKDIEGIDPRCAELGSLIE